MERKSSLVSTILMEIAEEVGVKLFIEPQWGYAGRIETPDGRIFYFHSTKFDINGLGSAEIAHDKAYASFFMQQMGYPVPDGESFYDDEWCRMIKTDRNTDAAVLYAETLGYPVLVKPNSESQGRGVEEVFSRDHLLQVLHHIFVNLNGHIALIQRVVRGSDYRIVVLDDTVLCAYRRLPLSVVGTGKHTILELLEQKQQQFIAKGRDTVIKIRDPRIERRLTGLGLSFSHVVTQEKSIQLLANANLSTGGDAEDVTGEMHGDYKKMAIKLTHDMGLRYAGIDIMTGDPIEEKPDRFTVIEINAAPGLDYYAESGETQNNRVRQLYKTLLERIVQKQ